MTRLYHSTSHKSAILIEHDGFKERHLLGPVRGVFVSDRPLNDADMVAKSAEVCFCLLVPFGTDLSDYEIREEDKPDEAYREWIVPAEFVNAWSRTLHLDIDELDAWSWWL